MKKIVLFLFALFVLVLTNSACMRQPSDAQSDTFKTKSGKEITITAIKHASIRINFDGKEIEIDPVCGLQPKTDYSQFPKADYIFVTHEHYDHCDAKAIRQLEKPSTVIITNANSVRIIGKGKVMRKGDRLQLSKDISVEAVPAYNITPGHLQYHPKGRDNGYILTLDDFRIYISGDTEDIPEMKDIKNIDVAFLSTNQPFTMTPAQTAKAAKTIKPKVLFPYHYSDTDVSKVKELLNGTGIDVRIRNYQ